MPKRDIDYSNTIIYMICCKDPTITDVYVGHTTNLPKRKTLHKGNTNNQNNKGYNVYVYQFIRENGGWENWEIIVLETKSCIDGDDARKLEREWFEKKGATLNKIRPFRSNEELLEYNKERNRIHNQEHPEEIKEYRKIYREDHREEINEKRKIYYEENKDKISEKSKIYHQENRDTKLDKMKKYYEENKEEISKKQKERYALKKLQKEAEVKISL